MLRAEAFSPCNITGFFQIHRHENPLQVGSTGASVAITHGVTTRVEFRPANSLRAKVTFNGRSLPSESVSNYVVRKYAKLADAVWNIKIEHECLLPTGRGYGTSGAGALSLSLAINEALGAPLSKVEAAQIAHVSEIACGTGLGTVASVFVGGMTLRLTPGAPGQGIVQIFDTPRSIRVLSHSFGPISTKKVLDAKPLRARVGRCGQGLLKEFELDKSVDSFVALSRRFSNCLGLRSARLTKAMNSLDSKGVRSSMMMLGESLFLLVRDREVSRFAQLLRDIGLKVVISHVAGSGARVI